MFCRLTCVSLLSGANLVQINRITLITTLIIITVIFVVFTLFGNFVISDCNIGNSRDTSFEKLVLQQTKGRGVDYVLNSLAEDKLQASIRCIANGGHFLEIGKFDLSNNSPLPMKFFAKNAAFHGVMLDCLFDSQPSEKKKIVYLLNEGITKGYVKPLVRKIFKQDEVEQAFRYMAAGKHIGKVLINIKKEEASRKATPSVSLTDGIPR